MQFAGVIGIPLMEPSGTLKIPFHLKCALTAYTAKDHCVTEAFQCLRMALIVLQVAACYSSVEGLCPEVGCYFCLPPVAILQKFLLVIEEFLCQWSIHIGQEEEQRYNKRHGLETP
jgi:hypothetical protein